MENNGFNSTTFKINQQGEVVYFICDVKELFGVSLDVPGVKKALRTAFKKSHIKKIKGSPTGGIPYDTGLMMSSFTMEPVSNDAVICYFDPNKILGKERKGQIVKYYYPAVLFKHRWHTLWVYDLAKTFYEFLLMEMVNLDKEFKKVNSKYQISTKNFDLFWIFLILQIGKLIKEIKKQQKQEKLRKERIDAQRKEFQEKIKNSVNSKQRR